MDSKRQGLYKQYVFAGFVISGLQFLDGLSFAFGFNSNINTAYSWIELMWFLVSIVTLIFSLRDELPFRAPLIYTSYIILNVFFAALVFEPNDKPPGYHIPGWFSVLTIGFALIYALKLKSFYRKYLL